MERLLAVKLLPVGASRRGVSRLLKGGQTYCQWRGYVNCLKSVKVELRFTNTQCSCTSTKQLSRGYRALRNHVAETSYILRLNKHNGNDWTLLAVPKRSSSDQKKEGSSSNEESSSTNEEGSQSEEESRRRLFNLTLQFGLVLNGLLFFVYAYAIKTVLDEVRFPDGRLPRHVTWEEFEKDFLLQGFVNQVEVFSDSYERSRREDHPPDNLITLHPPFKFPDNKILVDDKDFKQKLKAFENKMHVPFHERIKIEDRSWKYMASSPATYEKAMNDYTMMMYVCFLVGCTALVVGKKIHKNFLREAQKFREQAERNFKEVKHKSDMMKSEEQEIKLRRMEKTENKADPSVQRQAQEIRKQRDKKEEPSIQDMIRSLNDDNELDFKKLRGDLIMKDELSMKDVAGLHEPKVEVLEFIDYIKNPERFQRLGAKIPRGALLTGPPGCGKTLLAKALAAECEVPFYFVAASELESPIGGQGASRIRSLFKEARRQSPCIIYLDELDAIGKQRSTSATSTGNSGSELTLNQLLSELDGMHSREGVIVIASTNRADVLDKALLRPGRFDRHINIDLPTMKERIEHFDLYLSKLALASPLSTYSTKLAQLTPGMSGADIANICNEAAIHAARIQAKKVTAKDFEYAIERKIAGAAKATNTIGKHEKKVIAYHESGHALIGWLLEHTSALLKVTIVPRTSGVGGFAQYLPEDNTMYTKEHLFDMMCMALGGRVAETLIFNHVSTGAQDDLRRVTESAYAQIRTMGMSETFGLLSYPADQSGLKPFSKQTMHMLDLEARQLIAKAHRHTETVLSKNKDKLHKIAGLLLERETISAADVENLIGPPPFGQKIYVDPMSFYEEELSGTKKA